MIKHKCRGVRLTGIWRGYSCGAAGVIQHTRGRWYCANHIHVKLSAPEKFKEVVAARKRRDKQEDARWAMQAGTR